MLSPQDIEKAPRRHIVNEVVQICEIHLIFTLTLDVSYPGKIDRVSQTTEAFGNLRLRMAHAGRYPQNFIATVR